MRTRILVFEASAIVHFRCSDVDCTLVQRLHAVDTDMHTYANKNYKKKNIGITPYPTIPLHVPRPEHHHRYMPA